MQVMKGKMEEMTNETKKREAKITIVDPVGKIEILKEYWLNERFALDRIMQFASFQRLSVYPSKNAPAEYFLKDYMGTTKLFAKIEEFC